MGRGLSEQQEDAIRRLGEKQIQRGVWREGLDKGLFPPEGVRLRGSVSPRTNSGWASMSRTLRRLESRGLIHRGWRTCLSLDGWELFAQLTGDKVPWNIP
jgi:hypothetical protein